MTRATDRLAGWVEQRARAVLVATVALAALAVWLGGSVTDRLTPAGVEDPASESSVARDRLERALGHDATPSIVVLVATPAGVGSRPARARIERVARALDRDPAVARVETYDRARDPGMVARDGLSTYVAVRLRPVSDREAEAVTGRARERLRGLAGVHVGGPAAVKRELGDVIESDLLRAELIAFPLVFLLSLWFFRGAVAALLPPLIGGLAVVGTMFGLRVATEVVDVSLVALNLVLGLGLGLAIDYSLLVVSRYREELARSGPGPEALRRTLAATAPTVLFSALAITAAMASLLVFPQPFLYSMGLGGMIVSAIAACATLGVLPALLWVLRLRVDGLAPRFLRRRAERETRPDAEGGWYRLARGVMRRPGTVAAASAALLIALGLPSLSIDFTGVDASLLPPSAEARQVDDALARDFSPYRTEAITVAVSARAGRDVERFAARLRELEGVRRTNRPVAASADMTLIQVVPRSASLTPAAQRLVRAIRAAPAPAEARVTGRTAEFVDLKASLAARLPVAVALVVVTTLFVVFAMTGSLVLPIKALAMNALTLSATLGLLVLVFQHGRFEDLLGYDSPGALDITQPIVLCVMAFGLSTDYGIFLLARIKEAHDRGASGADAVAIGLERTGRIVTAAALLLCVAIGAFVTARVVIIKEFAVGTAAAVIIDATIVRALLVPSLMRLLGRWNWWAPARLRRRPSQGYVE